jgi:hypothetical protein
MKKKISQNFMVLNHMNLYGKITQRECALIYEIWRLSARIYDLEKTGFEINHHLVKKEDGSKHTEYSLKKKYYIGDYLTHRIAREIV